MIVMICFSFCINLLICLPGLIFHWQTARTKWNIEHQDDGFGRDFHNSLSKWDRFNNWICFGVSSWADIDTIQFINVYNRLWLGKYTKNIIFSGHEWHPIEQKSECPNAKADCNRLLQAHQLLCGRGSVLIFLALCKKSFGWNPWNPRNFRVDNNFLDSQVVPNPFVWEQGTCRVFIVTTQALRTLTCRFICSFTTRKGSDMEHGPHGPEDLNSCNQICNLEFETWGYLHAEIDVSIFLHFSVSIYFLQEKPALWTHLPDPWGRERGLWTLKFREYDDHWMEWGTLVSDTAARIYLNRDWSLFFFGCFQCFIISLEQCLLRPMALVDMAKAGFLVLLRLPHVGCERSAS